MTDAGRNINPTNGHAALEGEPCLMRQPGKSPCLEEDGSSRLYQSLLEVAGGVLSVVSLLLHTVDRVEALRAFWASVKDAPAEVASIIEGLEQIRELLQDRAYHAYGLPVPSEVLLSTVTRCEERIASLQAIVEDLEPNFRSRHKTVRAWTAYKAARLGPRLKRFQESLAEAKMDLVLASQHVSEQLLSSQSVTLNNIMDALTVQHSGSIEASGPDVPSSAELMSKIDEHLAEMKKHVFEMKELFPKSPECFATPVVATAMNAMAKKALRNAMDSEEMKEILHSLVKPQVAPSTEEIRESERSGHLGPSKETEKRITNPSTTSNVSRYCEKEYRTSYSTVLGTVYYQTRIVRSTWDYDYYGESSQRELETLWTIVPSLRLIGCGFSFLVNRSIQGWKHQIQYFPVVPRSAEIFKFCVQGNVDGVKQLLQSRQANPNACDSDGYTALHRAAALRHVEICRILLQNGANANAAGFISGETALHHLPVNRSRVNSADMLETVRVLVNFGSDPTSQDSRHQSAIAAFENFFNWPGRIALREEMAKCLLWLRSAPYETVREEGTYEPAVGRLYNGIDVDAEVESLDAVLKPGTDFKTAFGPLRCPGSVIRGWNVLHMLLHLRVEPAWHPWSEGDILQQKQLWTDAIARILDHGVDPHAVDWEGNSPTRLALRSLFTFHVWQNALSQVGLRIDDFIRRDLMICSAMAHDGWDQENLGLLFSYPTEKLYLDRAQWREIPEFCMTPDGSLDGLYVKCCWFQLMDLLRHRSLLPRGWLIITEPRQFCRPRHSIYWHPPTDAIQADRPGPGASISLWKLRSAVEMGKGLVDELADSGVAWQGV